MEYLDILFSNMPMKEKKGLRILNIMDVQDIFVGNKKYYGLTKVFMKLT